MRNYLTYKELVHKFFFLSAMDVAGLTPGKKYKFRVRALNKEGESDPLEAKEGIVAKNPFGQWYLCVKGFENSFIFYLLLFTCFSNIAQIFKHILFIVSSNILLNCMSADDILFQICSNIIKLNNLIIVYGEDPTYLHEYSFLYEIQWTEWKAKIL